MGPATDIIGSEIFKGFFRSVKQNQEACGEHLALFEVVTVTGYKPE
jgi:hypothetical protein